MRVELLASKVHRFGVRRATAVDTAVSLVFAAFGATSVRYTELTLRDAQQRIAQSRRVAQAAILAGGPAAADAREVLKRLDLHLFRFPTGTLYLLAMLTTLPLIRRRTNPVTVGVLVIIGAATLAWYAPFDNTLPVMAAWLAVYSIASHGRQAAATRWAVIGAGSLVLVVLESGLIRRPDFPGAELSARDIAYSAALLGLLMISAMSLGEITRRHRQAVIDLEVQARLVATQQGELARSAILDERVRIARELHDVVAHHVSVMGVQAGAARLRLGAIAQPDHQINTALTTIEQSSRQAVDDLHRLLGFLRNADTATPSPVPAPQPSLDQLSTLLSESSDAGLPVAVAVHGDLTTVPTGISLAAFRIVQEALTNVRKHAPGCRRADLDVRVDADNLRIVVRNEGNGAATLGVLRPGHGIVGMRERASLHSGDVRTERTSGGGFVVEADLPMKAVIG